MSVALLAVTNAHWLVYYLAEDMTLSFLYKILRRDFIYAVFFKFICVPEHQHTFWCTRTGWRDTQGYFLDNIDDAQPILIFEYNRIQWRSIEAEVKVWTHVNLARWEEEKPEWFTEHGISTV